MAIVTGKIVVQAVDGNDIPYSIPLFFTCSSGLLADIQLFTAGYYPLLDAATQDQLIKADIIINDVFPSGLKSAPVSGTNNEVGALMKFAAPTAMEPFSYWYPNWLPAGFESAHPNLVDLGTGTVGTNLSNYINTVSNNTRGTDEDGNNLGAVQKAIKSVRKQRRALGRVRG